MRPCLECGVLSEGSRCPVHRRGYRSTHYRGSAAARGYGSAWRILRKAAIDEHVARFGWLCPGYGLRPAHPARDLTGDHLIPLSLGGKSVAANVRVLCHRCNAAKGAGGVVGGRGCELPAEIACDSQSRSPRETAARDSDRGPLVA